MKSVTVAAGQIARNWVVACAAIVATCFAAPSPGIAETQAQACDRVAGDAVKIDSIDGQAATAACSDAVAASPQDKHLQYEYARALEHSGKRDQAKQIYQWIAGDGYAPATAALARLAGPLTGEAADREKFAQRLDAIAAIAARIAKSTPRDHDDPNTVLATTGKDPAKILAWVKANTRIVPYAGMLRGASGVLMDRAGNSLDRALFLADLLHRAGYNVRIARAQISPQAAEALRVRFVNSAPKPMPPVALDKTAILKQIGQDPRLDPKLVEQAVDKTIAGSKKFNSDVKSLYEQVLPAVLQAIGNDPARDARLAADADAILRDHYWVQQQNSDRWNNLDPDSDIVGDTAATATFLPGETPSSLKHRVTLRLALETLKDGRLAKTPLLQESWLPAEVAGKPIVISHGLYPQVPIDGLLKRTNPRADFIQGLADAAVVMPTLQVGAQLTRGQLYDFSGQMQPPRPENLASMGGTAIVNAQALSRGIASAFGDSSSTPTSATIVTAEWLEIDVAVPGKQVEKHRRAIFDLIGAAARANPTSVVAPVITNNLRNERALALSATIDVDVFGATPSGDWIRHASLDGTAQALTLAAKAARTARSLADAPPQSANRIEPQLWGWADNRIASTLLPGSIPTAPNIALLWQTIESDSQNHLQVAFDIISNDAATDTNFAHRVAQGVMDTIMEHTILAGGSADPNTAVQHATEIGAGRNWTVLQSMDAGAVGQLSADRNAQTLIKSELTAGNIVILPTAASTFNQGMWWRIDPVSGRSLGIGRYDRGVSMVEYAFLVNFGAGAAWCLLGAGLGHVTGYTPVAATIGCVGMAGLGAYFGAGQEFIEVFTAQTVIGITGFGTQIGQMAEDKGRHHVVEPPGD